MFFNKDQDITLFGKYYTENEISTGLLIYKRTNILFIGNRNGEEKTRVENERPNKALRSPLNRNPKLLF